MAKKKKTGRRIALIILSVLLAFVLVISIGATVYVETMLNRIKRPDGSDSTLSNQEVDDILNQTDAAEDDFTGDVLDPDDVTLSDAPADMIETADHILNILLIGQDRRENQGRQRSDSMILCTINTEKKTLVMTSFLRDLYVELPNWKGKSYSDNRLNVNYAIGGMDMLDECLALNFGITVDYNIEVDFSGFTEIIDLMGGVDIELTSREAKHLGGGLKTGVNHLNGEQALSYARIRKLDSDFGRTNRQRNVLTALLEQVRNSSMVELSNLVNQFLPLITTDMNNSEITKCIAEIFPVLSGLEVTTQYIPAEGTYKMCMIRGMSVLVPNMEQNRQILRDILS